ncbi:MAG: hypothetical protein ACJAX1_002639 [Neolewinella sp.]|jgi:hypothetical protein
MRDAVKQAVPKNRKEIPEKKVDRVGKSIKSNAV